MSHEGSIIIAAVLIAGVAAACGNTPAATLPEEGGRDTGSEEEVESGAGAMDSAEETVRDAPADGGAADGTGADAGGSDAEFDAEAGCIDCDGSSCCAPLVCRASGNCSTCLGMNEGCGGNQDCCSHVCAGGLCQ